MVHCFFYGHDGFIKEDQLDVPRELNTWRMRDYTSLHSFPVTLNWNEPHPVTVKDREFRLRYRFKIKNKEIAYFEEM